MSFTEDELQSFNAILEQRLAAQRRELERSFDLRMNTFRRDVEQRFTTMQQDAIRILASKLTELQNSLEAALSQKLTAQQTRVTQSVGNEIAQQRRQFEEDVERMLATQILGIEQLLGQLSSLQSSQETVLSHAEFPAHLEAVEVQTEVSWEDLSGVIGKALDERLSVLNQSLQTTIKNLEQHLAVRLHGIRDEFLRGQFQPYNSNMSSVQDMLQGIEHLEHIIESMQVSMTSNHALLSNRLYHHQQLPLERAHPGPATHPNGVSNTHLPATDRQGGTEEPKAS